MAVPMALEAVHAGFPSVAQDYFDGDFSFSCTNHGYWEGGIKLTEA